MAEGGQWQKEDGYPEECVNETPSLTNKVTPVFACPECGENDMDTLVWEDDGESVTCQSCGTVYQP